MLNVQVKPTGVLPILLSLPFQLGFLSIGLFFLAAFGAPIITTGALELVGLKISFFDLFVVFLVFLLLLVVQND